MKGGTPFDWLIVGLGNPGPKYARTRHNVGEETVNLLAERAGERMKAGRSNSLIAEARLGDERAVLVFPLTFVNDSGQAVGSLARRYNIDDAERIVIVHDELDLPPGVVKVKAGGGLAGHNGLRSITAHLGTQDFIRIRIGVGKPPHKDRGARHVLSTLPKRERALLDVAVVEAADAVEMIVSDGLAAAMNQVNTVR